ncbi:MAG: hypothetical protein LBS51_01055 [Oscillospiraceae bacterium]|jgi:hypothetical protein|nr:hypothetical protein [Oscillospiraceae bacterium]
MMTNDFENRLDEIRVELYEKTKTLRNKDAVAVINDSGREIAEKYGIAVAKAALKTQQPNHFV